MGGGCDDGTRRLRAWRGRAEAAIDQDSVQEIWGIWGDLARSGKIWADLGRSGQMCASIDRNSVRQPMCESLLAGGGFQRTVCQLVDWMFSKWSVSRSSSSSTRSR